jgi:hypothetical protein
MVDHDIVGLHVAMHDTLTVAKVQSLQKFVHVETNIIVGEAGIQRPEVGVVHILKDQTGGLALTIPDHIQQGNDIWATGEILKNFDLTLDLLLLDRFEDLDDTLLVVHDVDALEDFRVLSAAYNRNG